MLLRKTGLAAARDKALSGRERALFSLAGLSVGDALGEQFFGPPRVVVPQIENRLLPPAPWPYTDDTEMALSIVQTLVACGQIETDALAENFALRYDPRRGYGTGAHGLLQSFRQGASWKTAAQAMFGGKGSYGNGAAMRIAPLGGFLAGDMETVVDNAARSARVTHAHAEGIAGAVAVAVAAASAWEMGRAIDETGDPSQASLDAERLFEAVVKWTPPSETRERIQQAAGIDRGCPAQDVAGRLGSGQMVSAQDTVPFAIWCAAHNLGNFEDAFWNTVRGLGDRDTTCAMVGGITALSSRHVPDEWIAAREPLPPEFSLHHPGRGEEP